MHPKYRANLFAASEIDFGRKTLTERILDILGQQGAFDPDDQPEMEDHSPPDEPEPQTKQP